ncbi:MAG TPA: hypothetical protein VK919_07890 [Solirubrobacterales bacterium]|nr:hypothetical protein [Solirubrobacterales bacterium]
MNHSAHELPNRRPLAAGAGLAALILGVGAIAATDASKGAAKIATEVVVFSAGVEDGDFVALGKVTSKRKKCRANRKIVLRVERDGATKLADSGRTSARGGWYLIAPSTDDLTQFTVKAPRKRLSNGAVCSRAAYRDAVAQ